MTLISSIITDAFREGNVLPLGKAPNDNQTTEALRLLNALFSSIYGTDAGEGLVDWPLGNFGRESQADDLPYTERTIDRPEINRRLLVLNEVAKTVYLTLRPQDGARMGLCEAAERLERHSTPFWRRSDEAMIRRGVGRSGGVEDQAQTIALALSLYTEVDLSAVAVPR